MGRILIVLGVVSAICLGAASAGAAPSFHGYTGLVFAPTADALSEDEFNLAAFTLDHDELGRTDIFGGHLGVGDGLEVGALRIKPHSDPGDTLLAAKYRIQPETDRHAAVPVERPIHPQQVLAMLYRNLGIDVDRVTVPNHQGRPQYLVQHRDPIHELT